MVPRHGKRQRHRAILPDGGCTLSGLQAGCSGMWCVGPVSASATGQLRRMAAAPYPAYRLIALACGA
ncbi:hypothetical protein [Kosakonia sp. MUSA4]|uniref:hypothetical protein n=1 Tax=Kosakonia sp. MUSA4 TaxID=2067958 RepID=UPI001C27BCED|nr:hypothetical protein [Kosakonia sp. MUSA4]